MKNFITRKDFGFTLTLRHFIARFVHTPNGGSGRCKLVTCNSVDSAGDFEAKNYRTSSSFNYKQSLKGSKVFEI